MIDFETGLVSGRWLFLPLVSPLQRNEIERFTESFSGRKVGDLYSDSIGLLLLQCFFFVGVDKTSI